MYTKGDYYIDVPSNAVKCKLEDGFSTKLARFFDADGAKESNEQLFCAAPELHQLAIELFELLRSGQNEGGIVKIEMSFKLWLKLLEESSAARAVVAGWKDRREYGSETD